MISGAPEHGPLDGGKAIVLFSAGMDSATSYEIARDLHDEAIALFVDFEMGQPDNNYPYMLDYFAKNEGRFETISVGDVTDPDVGNDVNERLGLLTDITSGSDVEDHTKYIPMRSMVFATCLAIVGDRLDAEYLYWSFHQDEPLADLDESDEVIETAEKLAQLCAPPDYDPVFVNPLGDCQDGAEVVELGEKYDVPWEDTVSCLRKPKDHYGHCWDCDKCRARLEEFAKAGVEDPRNE